MKPQSSIHTLPDQPTPEAKGLSRSTLLLFALTSGLAVADIYYAQPLMANIARDFDVTPAFSGMVVSVTQLGYVFGLLLLVPLGDLVDRRKLILAHLFLSVFALLAVGFANNTAILVGALSLIGLLAVVIQMLVALAAVMSAPSEQGRAVGAVTSGVVFGIIASRSLAGPLAELSNWRMVYIGSAVLMLMAAWALANVLPQQKPSLIKASYAQMLRSAPMLLVEERLLRVRAGIALLLFAGFGVLWSALALALAAAPLSLSPTEIGWFGLAGLAGIVGASCAGSLTDRGLGHWTTGIGLTLMLVAWWLISQTTTSLWIVAIGVAIFDLGGQAVHVTSQSLLFKSRPDARNRLVAAYMLFHSTGIGLGALASTAVFASFGWRGVCMLGAGISASALVFWILTLESTTHTRSPTASETGTR